MSPGEKAYEVFQFIRIISINVCVFQRRWSCKITTLNKSKHSNS